MLFSMLINGERGECPQAPSHMSDRAFVYLGANNEIS